MSNLTLFQRGYGTRKPTGAWARVDMSHPISNGILCYLPLTQAGGTVLRDQSYHGNNWTLNAGITWTGNLRAPNLACNGTTTDAFITGLSLGTPLTIGIRCRLVDYTANQMMFEQETLFTHPMLYFQGSALRYNNNGTEYVNIDNTVWSPVAGSWHDFFVTDDGANAAVYVDGGNKAFLTGASAAGAASTAKMHIGNFDNSSYFLSGTINYFAMWSRALLRGEVETLYREPLCILQQSSLPQYMSQSPPASTVTFPWHQNLEPQPGRRAVVSY